MCHTDSYWLSRLPVSFPPPVYSYRWPRLCPAVWQTLESYLVMWEACHRKRKVKETKACALHSFRVLCVGFDTSLGQPDFLKQPFSIGNHMGHSSGGSELLSLFILFCLAALSHGWKRLKLNLMCSDEFLLLFFCTQSAVQHEYQI